jgi:hypothetical protein
MAELTPIIAELETKYSGTQRRLKDGKHSTKIQNGIMIHAYKRQINGATKWLIHPHECYLSIRPGDLSYMWRCFQDTILHYTVKVAEEKGVAAQTSLVSDRFSVGGANYKLKMIGSY